MHNCPECGQACYCNGDIDDIDTGDQDAEDGCTHCAEGDSDDDEEGDCGIWDWDPCGGWTAPDIDRNEPTIGDVVLSGNHPPRKGTQ